MNFNIDVAIIIAFLIITLIVGIGSAGKIRNIKDYALGGRNFSTGALVATIVATYASASGFFIDLNTAYTDGLFYIVAALCMSVGLWITACFFIPRMGEFLDIISVAEAMGSLYGKEVRIITAIAGSIGAAGLIAVQFKAFGNITGYFAGISQVQSIIISGIVVTLYSSVGGIRAVTTTDILQFFTFGFVIPLVGIMIWNSMYLEGQSISHIFELDHFKPSELVNTDNPKFWPMISLIFYFACPGLLPAMYQRVVMGRNLKQVKKAFIISGFLLIIVLLATCWISILVLATGTKIESNELLGFIIDKYTYTGLKGLIIIGIIAMAMSTADSHINAVSVLFTNDICNQLWKTSDKNQLILSKTFSCFLGIGGILLALYGGGLLSIVLLANSFYMPVVVPMLLFTILGFRSSKKSVLIAMTTGFAAVVIIKAFSLPLDPIFTGMLVNVVFLFGSHYLLKQPGGWVGIKDRKSYDQLVIEEERERKRRQETYENFSFIEYCKKHSPNNEISYTGLGVYFILYTLTTMYSTQSELLGTNGHIILAIYQIMMITGVVMAMYPIWPMSVRPELKQTIAQVAWPVTSFYMLVLFNAFFMLVSKFSLMQVSIFSVNLVISSIVVGWRLAIIMIAAAVVIILSMYNNFFSGYNIDFSIGSPGFVCTYIMMLIGTTLVIFIRPRQEREALAEEKAEHLSNRIGAQEVQIQKALGIREEFIRNVQHEYNTPMTGILSMADALKNAYYHLSDERRLKAIDDILKSAEQLKVYDENILTLAKLSKNDYKLERTDINFSDLVYDRISLCRKLYEQNKGDREFVIDIQKGIKLNGDKRYLTQVLDNMIINAISYCKQGKIDITLKTIENGIEFTITDEGIGIPQKELRSIFEGFVVSSRTHSLAGGRGLGLALARKVIEIHGGTIKAESDGTKGASFRFVLPLKP